MAKRKGKESSKKRAREEEAEYKPSVSSEALRGAGAVFSIALAGFLLLALAGGGGTFGASTYRALYWVFGVGYVLVPLSLLLSAVILVRTFEKRFGWVHIIGMVIFLLSGLGLINLIFSGDGGVVGSLITKPLIASIDTTATAIFLAAFLIASLVISFDVHLAELIATLRTYFQGQDSEEELDEGVEDVPIVGLPADDQEEVEEHHEEVRHAPSPAPLAKKSDSDGFPIIAASGMTYVPPPLSILAKNKGKPEVGDVKANMNIIKRTFQNFGIQVEMDEASIGPTVTRYSMKPAEGVRLAKIVALQSNLELALAASPVRIEAPIPGKALVGIEVPNIARTTLGLSPLISDEQYTSSDKPLLMSMGRTITGAAQFTDLARMPHLLVAGTTGAGKSVTMHGFIVSLLYRCSPELLRFIMVDPKRVELTMYNSIPHLYTPVITDAKKAIQAFKWLAKEMDRRYNILEAEKVRDIASYHENILTPALKKGSKNPDKPMPEAMPYIVVVVDELADIMQTYPRELEAGIVRLAQMSRAVGIHLILSTQRPSVKVITGLIKANVPARVALQVASQIDSRTILDMGGAEKLLGAGDMLFLSGDMSKPRRIQAPYISETEVKQVVAYLAKQGESMLTDEINLDDPRMGSVDPIFSSMNDDSDEDDDLYPDAKRTVIEAGKASTSYLQRKLGIGYARAARLMDILEERGIIGPADGAKPRSIIGEGNADDLAQAGAAFDADE